MAWKNLKQRSLAESMLIEHDALKELIVDASVIEANQCRPNKRKDGSTTQDPDAEWHVKAGSDGKRKSTYGYKAHLSVDEDGFIQRSDYSKGNLHDSHCFTGLLSGKESAVYADSAYRSEAHEAWLSSRNIKSSVIKRAYRNRPLTDEDKHFNRIHSGVRCTVERVFGVLKLHYGMAKARYLGLSRNRTRFELMCVAHNIKRGASIQQEELCLKNEKQRRKDVVLPESFNMKSLFGEYRQEMQN